MRRAVILVALALFFAFEATRAVAMGEWLMPIWKHQAAAVEAMPAPAQIATLIAFVIPFAAVVFALRWLHRRLFRNGTAVNSLLTLLNFR